MTGLLQVRVERRQVEAEDICSYELVSADGAPLPPFTAGAHIDVHVGAGLVRQYSLCNPPQERHRYLIGVLRDPSSRGGSKAMHDEVQAGATLQISAPKNHFPLVEAECSLLLAGGIGVTPILAMAEALSARGAAFEMHYCARSPERTAFRQRITAAPFAPQVHFHYDSGDAAQKLDLPALLAQLDRKTHIYLCGPAGFIAHVKATAKAQLWPQDQLHLEYFGAAAAPAAGGDQPFEVKLASSGKVYAIPSDSTVLRVLAEAGVFIPASCEQGVCGTCLTRVLDGVPDHRDLYLDESEQAANDQFTPCCSRSKTGTLLLDL
ncbi:PDR/VanB family oxidoreductase [Duganella violaceipulchra]|uniref:PDR/VanB family oxidoreductase n=1 Tax=Duganella violaceipulchra TaxID=2849652 RepID=A0AA41H7C5_9BURK|nr:PDR/VanB family oxidoreductase [Duganella violaceicalia]MBV6319429.1 PDR/VanB family oxidoreductase [Duganella violaceicalia]MCP2006760.1 vanillate O-demethylase ferredoxin subunit [Duganella violaceicalia]